jgi:hypothetical protein
VQFIQAKILHFRQLLSEPIDGFAADQIAKAINKLEASKLDLHRALPAISNETRLLLEAADMVIERSRVIVKQTREIHAACAQELRVQERRFAFVRELGKPK